MKRLDKWTSQTIENVTAVQDAVDTLILRPLICFDKEEIINQARKIGTYDISIQPHDDCCTVFIPKSPETKASLKRVRFAEEKLDIDALVGHAISETQVEKIAYSQQSSIPQDIPVMI